MSPTSSVAANDLLNSMKALEDVGVDDPLQLANELLTSLGGKSCEKVIASGRWIKVRTKGGDIDGNIVLLSFLLYKSHTLQIV